MFGVLSFAFSAPPRPTLLVWIRTAFRLPGRKERVMSRPRGHRVPNISPGSRAQNPHNHLLYEPYNHMVLLSNVITQFVYGCCTSFSLDSSLQTKVLCILYISICLFIFGCPKRTLLHHPRRDAHVKNPHAMWRAMPFMPYHTPKKEILL